MAKKLNHPVLKFLEQSVLVVLLIFLGLWTAQDTSQFLKVARSTPGIETKINYMGWKFNIFGTPVVQFEMPDRKVETIFCENEWVFWDFGLPKVGTKIDVLYNPENPSDARINFLYALWFPAFLWFSFGVLLFIIFFSPLIGRFFKKE